MPNHVTNNFIYVGNEEIFKKLALNENEEVDFNKLIPRPVTLVITCGTDEVDTCGHEELDKYYKEVLSDKEVFNNSFDKYLSKGLEEVKALNIPNLKDEGIIRFLLSAYNKEIYGYANWYKWSRDKWGTKWNAYSCCGSYEFDTAWSTPFKWLQELGQYTDFILYYADEDLGYNFGCVVARDKKVELYNYREESSDEIKNMIIAMQLKYEYSEEELKEQLIDTYEYDEKTATEYSEKVDEFMEEFKTFANVKFNTINLPERSEV